MDAKKTETRFTINFNRADPIQLQAAVLLNKLGYRGKAKHIAVALLHYEKCTTVMDLPNSWQADEKLIESVVHRILRDKEKDSAGKTVIVETTDQIEDTPMFAKEINYDEAMEALGENGLDAVLGSLEMFRKNNKL